jgi:ribonuclease D
MRWQLIESDDALQQLLAQTAHCEVVMVDTEFMRRNTFYPEVALVQLCFVPGDAHSAGPGDIPQDMAFLIDPLTINDPTPLAVLFSNPAVLKVVHSASEDLEVFQRWLGVLPQPLFDTQRAAALLNIGFGMGYRALVHEFCGVDLPKGETRSDWLQRPLTTPQCEYAGLDVTWLLPVWRELYARCLRESKLQWVLADGRDATRALGTENDECYKRIKTAWKLNRRQLGILAAVCRWREDTAKRRDKPRGWIIDDATCFRLALDDPDSLVALGHIPDIPAQVVRRYGEELLALLSAQRAVGEEELPLPLSAPLNPSQRELVKSLKSRVRDIASGLSIAPEVLVQSKDYDLLLREAAGEVIEPPVHWLGWRQQSVFAPLRQALAGQVS